MNNGARRGDLSTNYEYNSIFHWKMQILQLHVQCGGHLFHSLNGFFGTNNQSRAKHSKELYFNKSEISRKEKKEGIE